MGLQNESDFVQKEESRGRVDRGELTGTTIEGCGLK